MIPVVMEPEAKDTSTWEGLLKSALGNALYIDLTEMRKTEIQKLADIILRQQKRNVAPPPPVVTSSAQKLFCLFDLGLLSGTCR